MRFKEISVKKLLTLSILILVMLSSFANVSPVAASPNTWSSAGSMTQTREEHTATLLEDGRVLVAGGSIDGQTNLASADCMTRPRAPGRRPPR